MLEICEECWEFILVTNKQIHKVLTETVSKQLFYQATPSDKKTHFDIFKYKKVTKSDHIMFLDALKRESKSSIQVMSCVERAVRVLSSESLIIHAHRYSIFIQAAV